MKIPSPRNFAQHLSPKAVEALPSSFPSAINPPNMPSAVAQTELHRKRHALPAVLMRAGTSKGLFLHREHLPSKMNDWRAPFLAAMGSRAGDARQIDGVGGATSTTSKIAVVGPSQIPGIDVEYTFAQVAVREGEVDFSGNCGNMASGVGPFALEEGMVRPEPGQKQMTIRILNTNTSRTLVETVDLDDNGCFKEDGDYTIPGVPGTGSRIKVAFVHPAGSMTGNLFPTGNREDRLLVQSPIVGEKPFSIRASMVDAANPFIFVDSTSLPKYLKGTDAQSPGAQLLISTVENIRRAGAVCMSLAESPEVAAGTRGTPKIALLSPPTSISADISRRCDIEVTAFSMGQPHPSLQLTGAACLGAAVCIEGTVAHRLASTGSIAALSPQRTPSPAASESSDGSLMDTAQREVRIRHPSGSIEVEVEVDVNDSNVDVRKCAISRTARRLFEGNVFFYR